MILAIVGTICLLVFGTFFASLYNGLVSLRSQLERSWSNVDVILKQRHDEISQLIQVVQQYAGYESGVLQKLAEARANYGKAASVAEKSAANESMSVALKGVLAIGENYPELKANQNFIQLQSRISNLEESIADRRETYNDMVANFNTRIEQFPALFVAQLLNYRRQDSFKASDAERSMPDLTMDLPKFEKAV